MPHLVDLANNQNGCAAPAAEWQRYTLTGLTANGQAFTLDDVHQMMVEVIATYRGTLENRAVQPAAGPGVRLENSLRGWTLLALKDHPNPGTQDQWANDWWAGLTGLPGAVGVPNNNAGEYWHVTGTNGYVELAAGGNPAAVTYAILLGQYLAAGGSADEVVADLITLARGARAPLTRGMARNRVARQIATALYLAEVHRNHLTLLVNLAMLDLLKARLWTLHYFFGNFHPMAQGGPMAHVGNGTAGALAGANAATRTRELETTIIMYWLKLLDPAITLQRNALAIDFSNLNAGAGVTLGAVRKELPEFDHPLLSALNDRGSVRQALKDRLLKGLITRNRLAYN
ncbi:MAG TPA: hypothetical protein VFJ82_18805 [Longimicrobium sp.]|nr:hypothetical protein [Longimicrobium sp.]